MERLAANQHVLDIAIANRDVVTLSAPFRKIDPHSFTGAEIRYLECHGYHRLGDNTIKSNGKATSKRTKALWCRRFLDPDLTPILHSLLPHPVGGRASTTEGRIF